MTEFLFGCVTGGITVGVCAFIDCHRHKLKRTITLEKEYEVLQQHVDKAVSSIERIIYGSKP